MGKTSAQKKKKKKPPATTTSQLFWNSFSKTCVWITLYNENFCDMSFRQIPQIQIQPINMLKKYSIIIVETDCLNEDCSECF